jgi:hypothetical protein
MLAIGDPMGSEMLFTILSVVTMCVLTCLYRLRPASIPINVAITIAAGLTLAALSLTRTAGIAATAAEFICIALGFHLWSIRRRFAVLFSIALVFGVGISPWVLTYKEHTGHYGFTSNGFDSVRDGLNRYPYFPFGLELQERSENWKTLGDIWTDVRDVSTTDPVGSLRLLAIKISHPWFATWSRQLDRYLLVIQLPWLLLFTVASCRTVGRWKQVPGEIILLHGYVAALWITAALVAPILRYLAPAFPFVVIVVLWHALDAGILREGTEKPGEFLMENPFENNAPNP